MGSGDGGEGGFCVFQCVRPYVKYVCNWLCMYLGMRECVLYVCLVFVAVQFIIRNAPMSDGKFRSFIRERKKEKNPNVSRAIPSLLNGQIPALFFQDFFSSGL